MPHHLVIAGVRPYEGRYEFDFGEFTVREWGWIKRLSGYMPTTIGAGLAGGDPELISTFAVIALVRAGKIERGDVPGVFDRFADTGFGDTITLDLDQAEDGDADGPPIASSNGSTSSSGPGSTTSSERSESEASRTGGPPSDTSPSAPPTWRS